VFAPIYLCNFVSHVSHDLFLIPNNRSCTEFFAHKSCMFSITWAKNIFPIFKCMRTAAPGTRTCSLPAPDAMDQTSHACNVILQYAGHVREDHKPSVNDVSSGRSGGGFAGILVGANYFREEGTSFTCRVHRTR